VNYKYILQRGVSPSEKERVEWSFAEADCSR
jgi:hypothetical protein